MPRVELPRGLAGDEDLPRTRRDLKNCFNNGQGRILGRPGINLLATQAEGSNARGSFVWRGALYIVFGTELRKVTDVETGATSVIGTIAGSAPIETDFGFNHTAIVVRNGNTYSLSTTDVLTDISANANFVPYIDVTHINGRFIYIPADGDPAQFTDVGAVGTIQAASFFDAEETPDLNNSCFNFNNTLYIGGTDSFELFRDQGTATQTNPFRRVSGARVLKGFIGGLIEYNESFCFIGRERNEDFGIFRIGEGPSVKISNARIDLLLSQTSEEDLRDAVASRFKWRGYDIITFTLVDVSFGFYAGEWFLLDSLVNDALVPWGGGFIRQFEGKYYTAQGVRLGVLAKVNTDYGNEIERIIDTAFEQDDGNDFSAQSVELGFSQGFNAAAGSIALRTSHDNEVYGPHLFKDTSLLGSYRDKLNWNYAGGLGSFDGFMGLRFYTRENVTFNVDHLSVRFR